MIESLVVTIFPVLFLIVLFGGGALLRRRSVDMDGDPPIQRTLFYSSKYLIAILWVVTILHSWGIHLPASIIPVPPTWISVGVWVAGFALLFSGRFRMGESFRIGSPHERTSLKVNGLFRFSRNPMYVGVYTTVVGSILYTGNLILLIVGLYIIFVHHRIILAEEVFLRREFGDEYVAYTQRVRRYL
jgi:protein-S-isoprenylcysteine O-methyltransferase Ste14